MKDKIIRLLKAIGIAFFILCVAIVFCWLVVEHTEIAFCIGIAILFIWAVVTIYDVLEDDEEEM